MPNGDIPINSSAPTLRDLYIEIRKGQEFFLYIFVVGLAAGAVFGTHPSDSTVAIGQPFDGKTGFSASTAMRAYASGAIRSAASRARSLFGTLCQNGRFSFCGY